MVSNLKLKAIVKIIASGYDPDKIFLFGSYANDSANENSDLDFLIIKETTQTPLERTRNIRNLFKPYPCAMDIFVYTPEEFREKKKIFGTLAYFVNKNGKVVYGN